MHLVLFGLHSMFTVSVVHTCNTGNGHNVGESIFLETFDLRNIPSLT